MYLRRLYFVLVVGLISRDIWRSTAHTRLKATHQKRWGISRPTEHYSSVTDTTLLLLSAVNLQ